MKMSCNGCRVLRKGCSDTCSRRPCLQWIRSPQAQANATLFLAKFYGRAGLVNLINSGADHLRPAILRSLLYEACGRIVNPVYGSVGLLWSGNWHLCQTAVEAVLRGAPISRLSSDSSIVDGVPGHMPYDIRHVHKSSSGEHYRIAPRSRTRFKRGQVRFNEPSSVCGLVVRVDSEEKRQLSENGIGVEAVVKEPDVSQGMPVAGKTVRLDLGLGIEPGDRMVEPVIRPDGRRFKESGWMDDTCQVNLGLSLKA